MTVPGSPGAPGTVRGANLERLRIDRGRRAGGRPPRRWGRVGLVALLALVLLLVAARRFGLTGGVTRVAETTAVQPPDAAGGREVLSANGYVQARKSAAVSAETQGRLLRLHVQEGSRVEHGDLLAELANEDLSARVARSEAEVAVRETAIQEARAERADAENSLARAHALLDRGLGTASALDAAQARYDLVNARIAVATQTLVAAHAEVRLARAELEKTRVRAPFTGTVLRKNAEVGEMVAPVSLGGSGSRGAIVTIADLDSLDVEVDVNEAYIGRLRLGQPARVTTDAYPDTAFAARVRQIVPTSDRQKATVLVKAEILAPDARLLPEMGARVAFLADASERGPGYPAVAESAVQRDGPETFVWLVRPGSAVERRKVTLGSAARGLVEITSGLAGGETVVVRAAKPLRDGAKVRLPAPN